MRDELISAIRDALTAVGVPSPDVVELERPGRREHGAFSTNVALASAKAAGRPPRELAADLVARLEADPPPFVQRVEVAGPGFVNFHLDDAWLHQVLRSVVDAGESWGSGTAGTGSRVLVEYVSANPTGPVHAGHARGAVYGDSLARILRAVGHEVDEEFYVNDRGVQMQVFAASLAARAAGEEPPEGGYQGDYITEWAAEMPADADPLTWGEARALLDQREVLGELGVSFDDWFSERRMVHTGAIDTTLEDLRARGVVDDADGAVWLRSTEFGDDKDRVLVKSDGEVTYLLPDIAYHRDKFARGYDLLVDDWGADHHG